MREHADRMNNLMMQHQHLMHHGPGIFGLLFFAAVWGALLFAGWRLLRHGVGWYKLLGMLLIGIGLLPLSGLLIPALFIVVFVKLCKMGKAASREREWAASLSAASAASSPSGYDALDEWERKVRYSQNKNEKER